MGGELSLGTKNPYRLFLGLCFIQNERDQPHWHRRPRGSVSRNFMGPAPASGGLMPVTEEFAAWAFQRGRRSPMDVVNKPEPVTDPKYGLNTRRQRLMYLQGYGFDLELDSWDRLLHQGFSNSEVTRLVRALWVTQNDPVAPVTPYLSLVAVQAMTDSEINALRRVTSG